MHELDNLLLPLLPTPRTLIRGGVPDAPGLISVTEHHFELNAGMTIAAPSEHSSPLTQHISPDDAGAVASLTQQLQKHREFFLSDFVAAACSGLLLTPQLGVRMQQSVDLCAAWTVLGEFLIRTTWPCPVDLAVTSKWPRAGSDKYLTEEGASRKPALTVWARGCFEQGALSALLELEGPWPQPVSSAKARTWWDPLTSHDRHPIENPGVDPRPGSQWGDSAYTHKKAPHKKSMLLALRWTIRPQQPTTPPWMALLPFAAPAPEWLRSHSGVPRCPCQSIACLSLPAGDWRYGGWYCRKWKSYQSIAHLWWMCRTICWFSPVPSPINWRSGSRGQPG